MSIVDSQAVFRQRAGQLQIPEAVIDKMIEAGWDTHGNFAHSACYIPGGDETAFKKEVLEVLLKDSERSHIPKLRRLFFESFTMSTADLRQRCGQTPLEQHPRPLAPAERSSRTKRVMDRLTGLAETAAVEPSNRLIDRCCHMREQETLVYIPWAECTSREDEMFHVKRDRSWIPTADGRLVQTTDPDLQIDVSSDLKLVQALTRRGIAFEIAGILTFECHQRFVNLLTNELQRPPISGYRTVSMAQAARADRELFRRLGMASRSGWPQAMTALPFDETWKQEMDDPAVRQLLAPLQATQPPLREPARDSGGKDGGGKGRPARRQQQQQPRGPPPAKRARAERPRSSPQMPRELIGLRANDDEGNAICFNYNMKKGCSSTAAQCTKGKHICAKCLKPHSFQQCSN